MTYTIKFREEALKEWLKLDKAIQQQFAKKLKTCCEHPHIPTAALRGLKDCYMINSGRPVFAWSIRSSTINALLRWLQEENVSAVKSTILPAKECVRALASGSHSPELSMVVKPLAHIRHL